MASCYPVFFRCLLVIFETLLIQNFPTIQIHLDRAQKNQLYIEELMGIVMGQLIGYLAAFCFPLSFYMAGAKLHFSLTKILTRIYKVR